MTTLVPDALPGPSLLATPRGKLMLAFLCMVTFRDFVDASITNVALPAIRHDLGFSVQALQWIPSAYLLTYGGFMLLGGRAADLLGRRRVLVAGGLGVGGSPMVGGCGGDRRLLDDRRVRGELRRAGGRASRAGPRRRHDVAGRALHPHHHLQGR